MKELRVAVLGAGTVGSEVIRLLGAWSNDLTARSGARLRVVGVAVSDVTKPRPAWIQSDWLTSDAAALVNEADIVVELIGGIDPARDLIAAALRHGASVVTGNKALMATHGAELFALAAEHRTDLYYEAAVAGAVPVVYALRESLAGDEINRVVGIVNGTTNYILDEMTSRGTTYASALADAQAAGFAEADPTADVDGQDAAAKAALLASLAFHTAVRIDQVSTTGIRAVTPETIAAARQGGYVVKLLAHASRVDDGVCVRVAPTLVPRDHPLATVHGSFNAVVVEATAAGRLMFYGRGAGGAPTASAVLSDVVAAATHRVVGGQAPVANPYAHLPVLPADRIVASAQVRLRIPDRPGVLAHVADHFGKAGISLQSVVQESSDGASLLVVVTHPCSGADLARVAHELAADPAGYTVESLLSVEEE